MRTHTKTFHIRFTEQEYERLCKYSARAGLPKTTYIRHMINGQAPHDKPPADYFRMMKEVYRVGNNLNQLASMAHKFGSFHAQKLDEAVKQLDKLILDITDEIIAPKDFDKVEILEQGRLQAEKDKEEAL